MLNSHDNYTTYLIAQQQLKDMHRQAEVNRLISQVNRMNRNPVAPFFGYLVRFKNAVNNLLGSQKPQQTTNCA